MDQSFFRLLPESFQASFREALETSAREVAWGAHGLRVLRAAEGSTYHEEAPERAYRLDLEPPDSGAGSIDETYTDPVSPAEIDDLLESGTAAHYEIPFSVVRGGRIRRGRIPCLVVGERRVTVVQKCRAGMDLALEAARAAFPERDVHGSVVSGDGPPQLVRPRPDDAAQEQLPLF